MTNQNPTLTAANIRYLLVIRELDTEERGARCVCRIGSLVQAASAEAYLLYRAGKHVTRLAH